MKIAILLTAVTAVIVFIVVYKIAYSTPRIADPRSEPVEKLRQPLKIDKNIAECDGHGCGYNYNWHSVDVY
jgi:hypothetical protein